MSADPFIGVDIQLNKGDLGVSTSGDLALVGDVNPMDNLWQAFQLRLLTTLGTYLFANNYGTLARQYVDDTSGLDVLTKNLSTEIYNTAAQDPRIKSVDNLTITNTSNFNGSGQGAIIISMGITGTSGGSASGIMALQ